MSANRNSRNKKQCEAHGQRTTADDAMEELTISAEGNQTIDEPPNLSSTPAKPSIELQVEDTGATSTTVEEDNVQILAPYHAVKSLRSIVVADENEAELDDSDDSTSLPVNEVLRVGDNITQLLPTSNDIQDFKANDPFPIQTTSASRATVADLISASSIDNDISHNEWVLGSKKLPEISNKEAWVVPNDSSTAYSSHEATSLEEETVLIEDQGGGASCLLVLPSTNWKVLREIKDGKSEIVVLPEKPFVPQEASSDYSSDTD
ncbi:PREDICTED: uncharacterized protein LOC109581812 isoform X2 [Amphimedon queenslandica]|uniref:Uncharacterized protein n=1 Tax=Amphimedon queenslandica TaxID=400682 RepID=A0A1X7UXX3_AMPQE|nr:PREDICTED: uncharacterized protein LOC109581812 isoform X2 [Amphimedon queenslandica]XP_019851776.1 PREDICTED: uncharacterized protein LOC109581812 isoform X2 [Amphimedon queenslandica]|eukprot:XP_019851775.1 PREDICTED: uncharacterized protein LOC109581812 isoform X2 [Amphimedon queenslandica]